MRCPVTGSLREFVDLALAQSAQPLVSSESSAQLQAVAARLPGVPRILFECRLASEDNRVDLSQSFLRSDLASLRDLLGGIRFHGSAWQNIASLLDAWSLPDGLVNRSVEGIWLEFDLVSNMGSQLPVPAVFLNLTLDNSSSESRLRASKTLQEVASILGVGDAAGEMTGQLVKYVDLLPGKVSLSYIGFMLSRNPCTMRVQFSGFSQAGLNSFLAALGPQDCERSYAAAIDLAFGSFEACVLGIDLAPEVTPRIGLELFPSQYRQGVDALSFLDVLVNAGLCTKAKCAAALDWPRRYQPGDAPAPWPEVLVLESLLGDPQQLGVIDRRINHFKLVCEPGDRLEAKVYLAADHFWARLDGSDSTRLA